MKTKILIIAAFLILAGCRSRKTNIEKTLASAEVEKIMQVEKHVEEKKVKDSVKVVEKKDEKKDTETNLHVEFDPKKNDSLEVNHVADGDSLKLKIKGNGIVIFDYKKRKQEAKNFVKEIFGSVTLEKISPNIGLNAEAHNSQNADILNNVTMLHEKSEPPLYEKTSSILPSGFCQQGAEKPLRRLSHSLRLNCL